MDFSQQRELVRVRHDLRRLIADGRRKEARQLLDRLRELAERDEAESAAIGPELRRWQCSLGL